MRLGMPWWIGAGDAIEGVRVAADLGFDLVELSLDAPWPEGLSGPELRDAAADASVALGIHAPWRSQSIAHPRGVLAQAAGSVAKQCVDLALGAKAEYVVFHVDARDFSRYPKPEAVERGLGHARETLARLASSAGEALTLVVENTSHPLATPWGVAAFLERLPDVGFCYDPGHAAIAVHKGVEGATVEPKAWLEALGRRLTLLHLMDHVVTERGVVDHLLPGAGGADLGALVAMAREASCSRILVEAFYRDEERTEATLEDLRQARERVAALL